MVKELKEHRITAKDGKILFQIFTCYEEDLPAVILEKRTVLERAVVEAFLTRYKKDIQQRYERSADRLKRTRTAPLLCKIGEVCKRNGAFIEISYRCTFTRCGRVLLEFEYPLCYDERLEMFVKKPFGN